MKPAKRMLSAILTLAMALTLCLPAMADENPPQEEPVPAAPAAASQSSAEVPMAEEDPNEEEPNPAIPVITLQPKGTRVKYGQPLTLTAEACVPNGDPVYYEWYGPFSGRVSGANLTINKVDQYDAGNYRLYVYNANDASCFVQAEVVQVEVQMTFLGVIWEGIKMTGAGLLELPLLLAMGFLLLLGGIALPFATLSSWLFGWPFPK